MQKLIIYMNTAAIGGTEKDPYRVTAVYDQEPIFTDPFDKKVEVTGRQAKRVWELWYTPAGRYPIPTYAIATKGAKCGYRFFQY